MSAAEVIAMIEKLPPEQRAEVIAYFQNAGALASERQVTYLPHAEAERIGEKVLKEHDELFRRLAQ